MKLPLHLTIRVNDMSSSTIYDDNDKIIAMCVEDGNDEFIVKACNSHEKLLEAAKYALNVFNAHNNCNLHSLGMEQATKELKEAIKEAS